MEIHEYDALALSALLERGKLSAVEVMQATLARIDAVNGQINAVISLRDGDALMAEARAADASPRTGWLHGIPMAVKDLSDVKDMPTSKGSPLFAGEIALQDDAMVAQLRAAGALFIGKTNTPEFGLGSHTFNPVHGATRNPYNSEKSSGGSSGGAAAALATRMISVADGSDMMGSLRNPAGWNNVYGLRPTWGSMPEDPDDDTFLQQLATTGPMARTPRDLAALTDTMTGADARNANGFGPVLTAPIVAKPAPQQRFGWLGDWDGAFPYEAGIDALSTAALRQIEDFGHVVEPIPAPFDADAMWDSWITLRSFMIAAGAHDLFEDPAKRPLLKPAAVWEIERGLALSAMDVHRASLIRADWSRRASALFREVDILVLPSAQCWPMNIDLVHPTEIAGVPMDAYHRWMQVVVPASLIGLPVVNIPVGFGDNGLPGGLQLIGPRGSDARLMQVAEEWHAATDWPNRRPPDL